MLLPLGGPKGPARLMFEMLASVLARAVQARALGPARRKRRTQELRRPRHRCRRVPATRRFYARRRYARGVAQSFAAAGGLRRDPAAGQALQPHRDCASQVRYPVRAMLWGELEVIAKLMPLRCRHGLGSEREVGPGIFRLLQRTKIGTSKIRSACEATARFILSIAFSQGAGSRMAQGAQRRRSQDHR